jgi:hypothetical protein
MAGTIKIILQLEQLLEAYRMMFKELNQIKVRIFPLQWFCKEEKKALKILQLCLFRRPSIIRGFSLFAVGLGTELPRTRDECGCLLFVCLFGILVS